MEQNFHLSEALAAVLEVFTLMESTVDPLSVVSLSLFLSLFLSLTLSLFHIYLTSSHHCSLSPDVDVLKQCLLVMGFPPSCNACVESADFVGKDTEQLVKLIVQVRDKMCFGVLVLPSLSLFLSFCPPSRETSPSPLLVLAGSLHSSLSLRRPFWPHPLPVHPRRRWSLRKGVQMELPMVAESLPLWQE